MHARRFVWTWWAGLIPDSFGSKSVFHVARFGVLRVRLERGRAEAVRRRRRAAPTAAQIGDDHSPNFRTVVLVQVLERGLLGTTCKFLSQVERG